MTMTNVARHIGRHPHRLSASANNPREATFAQEWQDIQNPPPFLNGGIGTLHMLLHSNGDGRVTGDLTPDQIETAATVVQWLGSPVGFGWLEETLSKMGYRMERKS